MLAKEEDGDRSKILDEWLELLGQSGLTIFVFVNCEEDPFRLNTRAIGMDEFNDEFECIVGIVVSNVGAWNDCNFGLDKGAWNDCKSGFGVGAGNDCKWGFDNGGLKDCKVGFDDGTGNDCKVGFDVETGNDCKVGFDVRTGNDCKSGFNVGGLNECKVGVIVDDWYGCMTEIKDGSLVELIIDVG